MSYDLNVLVINQERPSELPFKSSIELKNELNEKLRYHQMWRYMTETNGVWYCLGIEEDGWFNTMSIVDADFESDKNERPMPYWIENEDICSNLTPLIVKDCFKEEFIRIIGFLTQQSPIKTTMFLARYQGGEDEIICGIITINEFKKLIDERKVLFNVCYILRA